MKKIILSVVVGMFFVSNALASQVESRFIADAAITAAKLAPNAVSGSSIRLDNNVAMRARNAADSADVNLFKLNASDIMEFSFFPVTPIGAPSTNYQVSNKKYVDDSIAAIPSQKTWLHEILTLSGTDITNQYVDSSQDCLIASSMIFVSGVKGLITSDYTLSSVGSKLRITFVASTGWGTGSGQALIAGDKIDLTCQY